MGATLTPRWRRTSPRTRWVARRRGRQGPTTQSGQDGEGPMGAPQPLLPSSEGAGVAAPRFPGPMPRVSRRGEPP